MVANQLRARGVTDERVLAAMGAIPREAVRPRGQPPHAYADEALPIEAGQTISQPVMVAKMTELLDVEPGDRILEIGTGSGYQAAILAWLGAARHLARAPGGAHPDAARARIDALAPDLAGSVDDPRGRRQPRRPGRRAVGRDHRHGRRAGRSPMPCASSCRRRPPGHPGRVRATGSC